MIKFVVVLVFSLVASFSYGVPHNLYLSASCNISSKHSVENFSNQYDLSRDYSNILIERENLNLKRLLSYSVFSLLLLLIVILYLQNRDKNKIITLQATLYDYKKLEESIKKRHYPERGDERGECNNREKISSQFESSPSLESVFDKLSLTNSQGALKVELKKQIAKLCVESESMSEISPDILKSKPYQVIQEYIYNRSLIPVSNEKLWNDLEKVVIKGSKDFKKRLSLLFGGQIDTADLRLALLIKCGITPSQKAILLGRTKSTITYRRGILCSKLLGKDFDTSQLDKIIRAL